MESLQTVPDSTSLLINPKAWSLLLIKNVVIIVEAKTRDFTPHFYIVIFTTEYTPLSKKPCIPRLIETIPVLFCQEYTL